VLVEKVDKGRGDGGSKEAMVIGREAASVVGVFAGSLSATGTGRRRLRMEDAADIGSRPICPGLESGRGGGGEGGGDCWYVVFVL
jgi:hypothetical protein